MTLSGAMSAAFFKEAVESECVFGIEDEAGSPTFGGVMPFFSKESRARSLIEQVPAYSKFRSFRISLSDFREDWLPDLASHELMVGLNWYGRKATGYNYSPQEVASYLSRHISAKG